VSVEYAFGANWDVQADFGIFLFVEVFSKRKNKHIESDLCLGGAIQKYFAIRDTRRGFML
jgi:hypothetical protein